MPELIEDGMYLITCHLRLLVIRRHVMRRTYRNRNEGLFVKKPYFKFPFSILRSPDWKLLSPEAVKVYMELLANWSPLNPDKPIALSYETMKELCQCGGRKVTEAIGTLEKFGFIVSSKEWHHTTRYFIETKWFTGEY